MIRAVCLDLDGTLLRDDHADGVVRRLAAEIARERPDLDPGALAAAHESEWWAVWARAGDDWLRGSLALESVHDAVWRRALARVGHDDVAVAEAGHRRRLGLDPAGFRLYAEARDVLIALRSRGIRTAIVTNGPSGFQRGKLAAVGIAGSVDAIVVSGEVGSGKPEPAIFAHALAAVDVTADAALHVGDLPGADVAGARRAGMTAVWLDRSGAGEPVGAHAVVADLWGILPLLDLPESNGRAT